MRDWAGRRYWVVGADEGWAREVAAALSRLGVVLTLSGREAGPLAALAAALPAGRAEVVPLDVADRGAVEAAGRALGDLDGLVYLADLRRPVAARAWDADAAEAMADVNYRGALRCLGAALPGMLARGRGHVVLAGPGAGATGDGAAPYAASRAAVAALARGLRAELGGAPVTVQLLSIGPGLAPADAARAAVEHMGGDGFAIHAPWGAALAAGAGRLLPPWITRRGRAP